MSRYALILNVADRHRGRVRVCGVQCASDDIGAKEILVLELRRGQCAGGNASWICSRVHVECSPQTQEAAGLETPLDLTG
jgi:hypothetical protein